MAALLEQLEHGASERARQAAAYKLAASDDPAAVSALLSRFDSHPVERVRRAATYGITAAVARETTAAPNTAVVDALVAKLNAPFVPALGAVCGTPAVLHALAEASPTPQLLHALSEFWERTISHGATCCLPLFGCCSQSHLLTLLSSLPPVECGCVTEIEDYCAGASEAELESYKGLGRYQTQMPVDFYVTDRRNALVTSANNPVTIPATT